jgi:hypothetical protein
MKISKKKTRKSKPASPVLLHPAFDLDAQIEMLQTLPPGLLRTAMKVALFPYLYGSATLLPRTLSGGGARKALLESGGVQLQGLRLTLRKLEKDIYGQRTEDSRPAKPDNQVD